MNEAKNKKEIQSLFEELSDLCYAIYQEHMKYIESIEDPIVAISYHTEPQIEISEGKKWIINYTYPIINFQHLFLLQRNHPDRFPKYLDAGKIKRIEELSGFLEKQIPPLFLDRFFKKFSYPRKKLNLKDVQTDIKHILELLPGNKIPATLFLPLDNLDLENSTWRFSDGTILRKVTNHEFKQHFLETRSEMSYFYRFRPESLYVLARTFHYPVLESSGLSKAIIEEYNNHLDTLKIWADSLLLVLPHPIYLSSGYSYMLNPYAAFSLIRTRHVFHPLTSFDPIAFPSPEICRPDETLKTKAESTFSRLLRLFSDSPHKPFRSREFDVSFRRLEMSMSRERFVDAILDNSIGIEILVTSSGELETLKYKVERRGSYLLRSPAQRVQAAEQLGKLYIIRSKLVHSATEIKPRHVRAFIGPMNEISNTERFKLRWAIFHLHRKILCQYIKVLTHIWDDPNLNIQNHDGLIEIIDGWILQGIEIPQLYCDQSADSSSSYAEN